MACKNCRTRLLKVDKLNWNETTPFPKNKDRLYKAIESVDWTPEYEKDILASMDGLHEPRCQFALSLEEFNLKKKGPLKITNTLHEMKAAVKECPKCQGALTRATWKLEEARRMFLSFKRETQNIRIADAELAISYMKSGRNETRATFTDVGYNGIFTQGDGHQGCKFVMRPTIYCGFCNTNTKPIADYLPSLTGQEYFSEPIAHQVNEHIKIKQQCKLQDQNFAKQYKEDRELYTKIIETKPDSLKCSLCTTVRRSIIKSIINSTQITSAKLKEHRSWISPPMTEQTINMFTAQWKQPQKHDWDCIESNYQRLRNKIPTCFKPLFMSAATKSVEENQPLTWADNIEKELEYDYRTIDDYIMITKEFPLQRADTYHTMEDDIIDFAKLLRVINPLACNHCFDCLPEFAATAFFYGKTKTPELSCHATRTLEIMKNRTKTDQTTIDAYMRDIKDAAAKSSLESRFDVIIPKENTEKCFFVPIPDAELDLSVPELFGDSESSPPEVIGEAGSSSTEGPETLGSKPPDVIEKSGSGSTEGPGTLGSNLSEKTGDPYDSSDEDDILDIPALNLRLIEGLNIKIYTK